MKVKIIAEIEIEATENYPADSIAHQLELLIVGHNNELKGLGLMKNWTIKSVNATAYK